MVFTLNPLSVLRACAYEPVSVEPLLVLPIMVGPVSKGGGWPTAVMAIVFDVTALVMNFYDLGFSVRVKKGIVP